MTTPTQAEREAVNEYAMHNGFAEVWRSWRDMMLKQGRRVDDAYMRLEALPARDILLDAQIAFDVVNDFLVWYAAHRSAPPSDPAVAHVAKLENELGGMIAFMATRYTTGRGFQILEHARALLATLDAERKVTK